MADRLYQGIADQITALIDQGVFPPAPVCPASESWPNGSGSAA
ncbi:hypothetical protein [Sphingomonas sp. J315]